MLGGRNYRREKRELLVGKHEVGLVESDTSPNEYSRRPMTNRDYCNIV